MEQHRDFPGFWTAALLVALLIGAQILLANLLAALGFRYEWGDPLAIAILTVPVYGMAVSLLMLS